MAHQLLYSTSKLERFVLNSVYKNANMFQLRRYLSLIRNNNETSTLEHLRNQWRLLCNEPPKGFEKFFKPKKDSGKTTEKITEKAKQGQSKEASQSQSSRAESQKSSMHSAGSDKRIFPWEFKWSGGNKSFGDKKNEKLLLIGAALMGLFKL